MADLQSRDARVKARPARKGTVVLQMIVFAICGGWLAYGVFDRWHWQDVEQNWASTGGTIETAYLHEAMSRHPAWETGWTYSYTVDGQKYEAKSTALSNAYFVHMFQSKLRASYDEVSRPVGSNVSVYYDPAIPQNSVLDLATDSSLDWIPLSLSALCIGVAVLGAFTLAKTIKNHQSGA